jgi:uncharacterized protein
MTQRWERLLFAHWPVDAAPLRAQLPPGLELDLFDGQAWLGLVPFRVSGLRAHLLPPLPGFSTFAEVNLRTYVRYGERRGVWFFSLEAATRLGALAARLVYRLPYHRCRATLRERGAWTTFTSDRRGSAQPAVLRVEYGPIGPIQLAEPGSLAAFLTDRKRLFSGSASRLLTVEVAHPPWPLRPAEARLGEETLSQAAGLPRPSGKPLLHYSERIAVRLGPPRRVG